MSKRLDANQAAHRLVAIISGDIETPSEPAKDAAAVELGRRGGLARAKKLGPKMRRAQAQAASAARWRKGRTRED
jgi:hypothetical protein